MMYLDPTVFKGILAVDKDGGMGKDNDLPWHFPEDLKQFKRKTFNSPMIMGRKTFESFEKPLPGRLHMVLTRDKSYTYDHPDVKVFYDIRSLLAFANGFGGDIWVIGGPEIFRLFHDYIQEYHITFIEDIFVCDVFLHLSEQDLLEEFQIVGRTSLRQGDINYHFTQYVRR